MAIKTILHGIDETIDQVFGVEGIGSFPHYKHKTSFDQLLREPPRESVFVDLAERIYLQLESNLNKDSRFNKKGPSDKNWRFQTMGDISKGNPSLEKILEKKIANCMGKDWVNQVPVASGMISEHADKKRAIDLVYRVSKGVYEFIELKIVRKNDSSDSPLLAAMELLEYGVLYLQARKIYPQNFIQEKELFQANQAHLVVLAPLEYYIPYNLDWLEKGISTGLSYLIKKLEINILEMDFRFYELPDGVKQFYEPEFSDGLSDYVNQRAPVSWNKP